ncbi:MAG: hypothetical protein ACI9MB_001214 [Verrucomicrobiales bacterium]|jgi:hypothetical protein
MRILTFLSILTLLAVSASAQSTVNYAARHAHAANAGWIDLYSNEVDCVVVAESFLQGMACAGNFGWLDFGDGLPANGYAYSNGGADDCGVNLAADGALTGYAYSGNIGWVCFEQVFGKPQLGWATGAMSGFAYSGNISWIALDTIHSDFETKRVEYTDSDAFEMRH